MDIIGWITSTESKVVKKTYKDKEKDYLKRTRRDTNPWKPLQA